ncbi:MAG: hypothetical protein HKM95_00800, partial [Inquilinus sp.]|nr:hypothetical protein [Inquilinus sp.]
MSGAVADRRPVPDALLGPLRASDATADPAALRERLSDDGYLFLPAALDAIAVMAARAGLFGRLAEVGEIAPPAVEGIATGTRRRSELAADPGRFLKGLSEHPALRRVSHGPELGRLMAALHGEPVRPYDFLWLRATPVGRSSPLHFDHVYMSRGSARVLSVWIPLGPVPLSDGPLTIVEGSHRAEALIERFRGHDVDRDPDRPGDVGEHPVDLATRLGTRLLTADFAPGDIVVFGLFTLHGSLDNRSPAGRVRLSCDVRYQPAAEAVDERWVGGDPPGHRGLGYGGLNA